MSEIGNVRGPQPDPVLQPPQPTGTFEGFKVRVGEAFSRVAELFRGFASAVSGFFSSLFSMTVRQAPTELPRVSTTLDTPEKRIAHSLDTITDDHTITDMVDVQGSDSLKVSWQFARDLEGSGRHITIDGKVVIPDPRKDEQGKDIPWTKEEKVAFVANALVEKFGPDCLKVLTQYANQGTFGVMDTELSKPESAIETSDGRKMFAAAATHRDFNINFTSDGDSGVKLTFSQTSTGIQMLVPVSPNDTGEPIVPKEDAFVRSTFDIVFRNDGESWKPHYGSLHATSNLGE